MAGCVDLLTSSVADCAALLPPSRPESLSHRFGHGAAPAKLTQVWRSDPAVTELHCGRPVTCELTDCVVCVHTSM